MLSSKSFKPKLLNFLGGMGLLVFLSWGVYLWNPPIKNAALILLCLAVLVMIIAGLRKKWNKPPWPYLILILLADLFKLIDGAFLDAYSRFFGETLLLFLLAVYLLHPRYGGFTVLAIFWLLCMPLMILFVPICLLGSVYFAPLAYTPLLAFVLCWLYNLLSGTKYKLGYNVMVVLFLGCLSYIVYPNYWSYLSGKVVDVVHRLEPSDKRTRLMLLTADSNMVSLEQIAAHKIVVLDVWYTGCGVCFKQFPKLESLYQQYNEDTAVYIASLNLPLDKELNNLLAFSLLKEYPFHQLKALEALPASSWKVDVFPQILLFDKKGRLRYSGTLNVDAHVPVNNLPQLIEHLKAE